MANNTLEAVAHEIEFMDLILDVRGYYEKGSFATREQPPEADVFEIEAVYITKLDVSVDISNLLMNSYEFKYKAKYADTMIEVLEQQILEKFYQ